MSNPVWPTAPLSKLTSRIGDGIHGTPVYSESGGYPFVNGNNLKNGSIEITNDTKRVSREEYDKYFIEFDEKTLFLSINGTLGNLAKYKGEEVVLGKSAAYINCTGINIDFLFYYFQLKEVKALMWNIATGSTIKNLSLASIRNMEVPNPPENVAKKIADVLLAIDNKIDLNNRINTELEAMAKTLYDYWFVQFDFPDANGKPYKASGGKMVYNDTLKREIPVGWSDGTLDNLGQIVGGSTPSTADKNNFSEQGSAWITPNDLSGNIGNKFISKGAMGVTAEGIKSASLKKYPAGTVLLSSRAPIGYMAIARNALTTNQGFKSFIPSKGYPTEFVYFTVKNSLKAIIQYASGSTFKEVSGTVIKTVKLALPPNELVEEFRAKVEDLFKRQDTLEQENEQLIALRDWLLPMLMNGQVTVKPSTESKETQHG
ncbi:restriction endonuclease subunit S [Vibrio cholerae]|uniref:restriction endonuclease subunit S n=1 Tax=Vibrio cholerae TaxID=666 RepID=UPI0004E44E8E|nr:restriction endonuclease subunit S [Vibrio cholerae]EGR2476029.1 restriction endonuclease subunit S [Vibrio cholerae]EJL6506033.1 restriction endonuclease subunit S [Vibrio cholerae]KFD82859.1 type I restriction modification DNA specificity domain protein [Vibrio cholerae]GHZ64700.1 Restriction modification system DNA specificity domain protein [Vibrio cholerae]